MTKKKKQQLYEQKRQLVKEGAISELQSRGILQPHDLEILEEYAKEIALAYVTGEEIINLAHGKNYETSLVRLSRIRNSHINTANQLSKTLKLGPYGRHRFAEPEEKDEKKPDPLAKLRKIS